MLVVFPVRVRHRDLVRVGEERRGEIVDARRQFQKVVVVVFFAAACASSSSFFAFDAGFGGGGGGGGGVHHRRVGFCSKPIFFSLFFSFFLSRGKKEWRNYKPKANNFLPFFFLFSFEREKRMAK